MSEPKSATSGGGGGAGPAGGFEFQAGAAAYVVAHALSRSVLDWTKAAGQDVPVAVRAETGGAGDDWCIELESGRRIEVQCKKGLKKGADLWDSLGKLHGGL